MKKWSILAVLCLLLASCGLNIRYDGAEQAPSKVENFSFIHASDVHVSPAYDMPDDFSKLRSYKCVSAIKDIGEVYMKPYDVTAPKPSLMIVTGDLMEFSMPGVTWDVNMQYYEGFDFPVYFIAGNHDNTWVSVAQKFRELYGGLNYSFDFGGCHFIGLNSATIQEPIQSIDEVTVNFLRDDLKKVNKRTPLFLFFHHPFYQKGGFASGYDCDRILDLVRDYNVALLMDGHGHRAVRHDYPGVDGVEGGSTFSNPPGNEGFNIVDVKDNRLYVAYKKISEDTATKPLLEKDIAGKSDYLKITIVSPQMDEAFTGGDIEIKATAPGTATEGAAAVFELDDEPAGEMIQSGSVFAATINADDMCNGAHFVRVKITIGEKEYQKSVPFFVDKPGRAGMGVAKWRYKMQGSSQSTPLVFNGVVFAGANDGRLYAIGEKSGAIQWVFDAGAEIITSPAAHNGLILFGAGNGKFFALTEKGKVKWSHESAAPVYSSPFVDMDGVVYFGNNKAELTALDADTGKVLWINGDARFSVESRPFATGSNVYFGSWDGNLYCLDKKTGKTVWKERGPKNIEMKRTVTYNGPADNGPLAVGDKVYITDRGYIAGMYGADGAYMKNIAKGCSALGLSEDGKFIYVRALSEPLSKIDLNGNVVWKSSETLGRFPVSPLEHDGAVYVCENTGRFHAIDARTGRSLWEYQVTPKLFVMSGVSANDGVVFSTGMDGYVTAFSAK